MSINHDDSEENYRNYKKRRQRNRKLIIIAIYTVLILLVIFALIKVVGAIDGSLPQSTAEEKTEQVAKGESPSVSFMATGDNLIHSTIYEQNAARSDGNGYDFDYNYKPIVPLIADADLTFVNQETPVATAIRPVSNYPMFNTPDETVTALAKAGFNLFNLASNHTLDQGNEGMEATIDFMDTVPNILHFGAYRNYTDEHTPKLMEKNGITFAFVGITEMTNGMKLPADTDLDIIYTSDTEKIKEVITEGKKAADVVVLSVHWGDENVLHADPRQKKMAKSFADMGADLIIGHHPHVLQEIETITSSDGRKIPVVYSLGNFISAMRGKANHVGGFFGCTITKKDEGIIIDNLSFTPVINYFTDGYQNMRVIPFADYTEEMAASHGLGLSIGDVNEILMDTVGSDLLVHSNSEKPVTKTEDAA